MTCQACLLLCPTLQHASRCVLQIPTALPTLYEFAICCCCLIISCLHLDQAYASAQVQSADCGPQNYCWLKDSNVQQPVSSTACNCFSSKPFRSNAGISGAKIVYCLHIFPSDAPFSRISIWIEPQLYASPDISFVGCNRHRHHFSHALQRSSVGGEPR